MPVTISTSPSPSMSAMLTPPGLPGSSGTVQTTEPSASSTVTLPLWLMTISGPGSPPGCWPSMSPTACEPSSPFSPLVRMAGVMGTVQTSEGVPRLKS